MRTVPSRLASWNSSHNQPNQLHGLTLTELTCSLQELLQNTFSLQKIPCWSLELNQPGKRTIFKHFFWGDFLAALEEVLKLSQIISLNSRDGVCYLPRDFSQPIVLPG